MKWMHASVVFTSHHAENVFYRLRLGYLSMKAAKGWGKMHWTDLSLTGQCTLQCPSGNTGWKWLIRRPSNKVSPSRLARTSFLGPAMFNRIGQRLPCRSSFGNHWLWWLRTVCNPSECHPWPCWRWDIKNWIHHDYSIGGCKKRRLILTLEEVKGWNGSTTSSTCPSWLSKGSAPSGLLKIGPKRQWWRIGKSERHIQQVEVSPASPCSLQAPRALRALRDAWGSLQFITTWLTSYLNLLSMNTSTQQNTFQKLQV